METNSKEAVSSDCGTTMHFLAQVYLQDSLIDRRAVSRLQRAIEISTPEWSRKINVAKNEDTRGIDLGGGSLFEVLEKVAPVKWGFTSAVIKGAYDGLTLFFNGSRTGATPESNMISVELADLTNLEAQLPWEWLRSFLEQVTNTMLVRYAYACAADEFESKNMVRDENGVKAVGVNLTHALPGLYWLNYFGSPYIRVIGLERIRSAPAHEMREGPQGILIMLDEKPLTWAAPAYKKRESAIIQHLGARYYFSRTEPDRKTVGVKFDKAR